METAWDTRKVIGESGGVGTQSAMSGPVTTHSQGGEQSTVTAAALPRRFLHTYITGQLLDSE